MQLQLLTCQVRNNQHSEYMAVVHILCHSLTHSYCVFIDTGHHAQEYTMPFKGRRNDGDKSLCSPGSVEPPRNISTLGHMPDYRPSFLASVPGNQVSMDWMAAKFASIAVNYAVRTAVLTPVYLLVNGARSSPNVSSVERDLYLPLQIWMIHPDSPLSRIVILDLPVFY